MENEISSDYQLRGQRVVGLSSSRIESAAALSVSLLGVTADTKHRMDKFIEMLGKRFGIEIDVVDDGDWCHITNAICDPSILAIVMPNKLYVDIVRGEPEALFIFFHELGHLLLAHKPVLHFSESPATQREDSEWQADLFSEQFLKSMGVRRKPKQLALWLE